MQQLQQYALVKVDECGLSLRISYCSVLNLLVMMEMIKCLHGEVSDAGTVTCNVRLLLTFWRGVRRRVTCFGARLREPWESRVEKLGGLCDVAFPSDCCQGFFLELQFSEVVLCNQTGGLWFYFLELPQLPVCRLIRLSPHLESCQSLFPQIFFQPVLFFLFGGQGGDSSDTNTRSFVVPLVPETARFPPYPQSFSLYFVRFQ